MCVWDKFCRLQGRATLTFVVSSLGILVVSQSWRLRSWLRWLRCSCSERRQRSRGYKHMNAEELARLDISESDDEDDEVLSPDRLV